MHRNFNWLRIYLSWRASCVWLFVDLNKSSVAGVGKVGICPLKFCIATPVCPPPTIWVKPRKKLAIFLHKVVKPDEFLRVLSPFPEKFLAHLCSPNFDVGAAAVHNFSYIWCMGLKRHSQPDESHIYKVSKYYIVILAYS